MPEPDKRRQPAKRRPKNLTADQVVADQVRHLRGRSGLTQQELADTLGWTQSQVARLELGKRAVTVADLLALSWALDVAPIYLLAGSFTGEIPVIEQLRVPAGDLREWIRGYDPLPGMNYRRFFENIPDDEWLAVYGDKLEQRRGQAQIYEQLEQVLEAGGSRRPGSDRVLTAEQEVSAAEERARRKQQLDAAKKTRKRQAGS